MNTLTVAKLTALLADGTVTPPAATDYNGFTMTVNLAKPVDYISDIGKCVIDTSGQGTRDTFNLQATGIYRLWVAQGKPAGDEPITQEHLDTVVPWIRIDMARTGIYRIASSSAISIRVRDSDLVDLAVVPAAARKTDAINEIVKNISNNDAEKTGYIKTGRFCLMAIVCNAIHREQNEGHNWYTADTKSPRTPTGKACTIAGTETSDLVSFMHKYGHDAFHHLDTTTLNNIALAVSGDSPAQVDSNGLTWGGEAIHGVRLNTVFYVGEAAKGRFPAGVLGKAAIIICCNMASAIVTHITTRMLVKGADNVIAIIEGVGRAVSAANLTHEALLEIDTRLADMVSFTYGYATEADLVEANDYMAYQNHAKRNAAKVSSGIAIAQAVLSARIHKDAVEGAVANAINSLAASFAQVAAHAPAGAAGAIFPGAPAHDASKVTAKVGEDQDSKLIDGLLSGKLSQALGGGGAVAAPAAAAAGAGGGGAPIP